MSELREEVAHWASYCMGSCHGDTAPETLAMFDKVMQDDETYAFYLRTFIEYNERRLAAAISRK
jgi:hypothetical protein